MARFLDFEGVDSVLFDCDGVLLDSEPLSQWAWETTLSDLGVEIGDFAEWIGKTDQALAVHFASVVGMSPTRLAAESGERFLSRLSEEPVVPFEDALAAVERAERAGIGMAVVSNSEGWRLDAILASSGLKERFGVIVSSDDVARPKPDADVYLRAADLVGTPTSRCLAIEDSPVGITAARAAGMRVVAIDRGVFDVSSLAHATRVVSSLRELA